MTELSAEIHGRKQKHTDKLSRKPFIMYMYNCLGKKQEIPDGLGRAQSCLCEAVLIRATTFL